MKKWIIVIAVLFLGGCFLNKSQSAAVQPEREAPLIHKEPLPGYFVPKPVRVTAIGDSLTKGVGDRTNREGYLYFLEDYLSDLKGVNDVSTVNLGVSGNRSGQILTRLKEEKVKKAVETADLVLITAGGNDLMKVIKNNFFQLTMEDFEKEQQSFENNMEQILSLIQSYNPDVTVIVIGIYNPFAQWFPDIPEMKEILNKWNESTKETISRYSLAYFVEVEDLFLQNPTELLYEDMFHPNELGYERIAERVIQTLEKDVDPQDSNNWFILRGDSSE